MRNLDRIRPAELRRQFLEQLSADSWTTEHHVFSCLLDMPGVVPTKGLGRLRAAVRYLRYRGKIIRLEPLHSDGQVRWRLA